MSTVAEIESAIEKLEAKEVRQIADWIQEFRERLWDAQIDADIKAGRLDKLADEALKDYHAGRCKPLDEILHDE